MRILLFSDLHADLAQAARLVQMAAGVDLVLAAGDFARVHRALRETIDALSPITTPTILVPGNNERLEALTHACGAWPAARVLHGSGITIAGTDVYGLGGGVPVTPFGAWSYDFSEAQAADMLADLPEGALLVSHSPPKGHGDRTSLGDHVGSTAVLDAILAKRPRLVVCGHIHDDWGHESAIGPTTIINAGPRGRIVEQS
ncbi:MAG: metallophosphoesterase family protein [Phycisphaeraceae bacterium]|nr:metallophosphoesterase family protein [Phycisphaeraceae bacterium]